MATTSYRSALVTGATGGIGAAIAQRLAREGYALALSDLAAPGADQIAELQRLGAAAVHVFPCDLTADGAAQKLAQDAATAMDGLDVLVNVAGRSRAVNFLDLEEAEWTAMIRVNLDTVFLLSQAVGRIMRDRGEGGRIVNIASIAWANGGANPAYGAAKAGVVALSYNMAQSLGEFGITVNAVAPGVIDTPMVRNGFPGEGFTRLSRVVERRSPIARLGKPDDVAHVVSFLAAEEAGFITGAVVPVTGGIELLPTIGRLASVEGAV